MLSVAYMIASFLAWMPVYFRAIVLGFFAVVVIFFLIKIVCAVLNAIPFL